MEPHVFVIMPFGVKEVRPAITATADEPAQPASFVNFDEVYDLFVGPALTKAGCQPFRADKEPGAGDIRTDMYFELVTADVVLADISILNPNVFYELGIRHGVAPRGVLMIHGGWTRRPFDVAPDRTFDYDGKLFPGSNGRDDAWHARAAGEVESMAGVLRAALDADHGTIGSPVYKELVGLKAVDWTNIETARAKYYGDVFVDWKARVEVAKLNGWPGDVLTLADDAPTRFHRAHLLWKAAHALCSMHRFEAALPVLRDLCELDPNHRDGLTYLGLVLNRLGKINEAKVHMLNVVERYKNDTEAQGILARVYKDLWRLEWKDVEPLADRQRLAVDTSAYIASAICNYDRAARAKFDYYTGINVVSFVKLLEHLKDMTGERPVDSKVTDLEDLVSLVRFTAKNTLDCAGPDGGENGIWAAATLGELFLVLGDEDAARSFYTQAANAPATTYFTVNSMLDQIRLFESLSFRPAIVARVKEILETRCQKLEGRIGGLRKSEPKFGKIVVASGHMIDKPDRESERFPARKEQVVRERIAQQLDKWGVGAGDLAICGAARGADMLFAELCADRGAEVWLFLALPEGEFLDESVRLENSDWEPRFRELGRRQSVTTFQQLERLKSPPKGASVFSRNNLWMINSARVEAKDPGHLYALLVWDEQPQGDGPGGTSDFRTRIKKLGANLEIINPTTL